jgi:uncharacterized integral membrane protein
VKIKKHDHQIQIDPRGILLLFGIIFAMQNSTVVEVWFLVWSVQMPQAMVIFLTGAVGTIIGFLFGTAFKISRQS